MVNKAKCWVEKLTYNCVGNAAAAAADPNHCYAYTYNFGTTCNHANTDAAKTTCATNNGGIAAQTENQRAGFNCPACQAADTLAGMTRK
jgi:hypothetical protein